MKRLAVVVPDWSDRLSSAGLSDPARLLEHSPADLELTGAWKALTKPGLQGRERWRWRLDRDGDEVLYVKRYNRTPASEQIDRIRRQSARHSRAWWEFHQSAELERQYIPAVRAIAVAEEMRPPLELHSAVLFERAPGDAFDRTWTRLAVAGAPVTYGLARHDVTRRLARFISAFHQTGTCHRDLYLCHVFTELDPDGSLPPGFTLIDLARTHRPRWRRLRWIIKDLSQLDTSARQIGASRTDRLRFLVAYLALEPSAARVRWYARRVVRKSNRILRRIERKSRSA